MTKILTTIHHCCAVVKKVKNWYENWMQKIDTNVSVGQ